MKNTKRIFIVVLLLALSLFSWRNALAQGPDDPVAEATARLMQATGGDVRITNNPATGAARFVVIGQNAIPLFDPTLSPEAQAQAFFDQYGELFGISNATAELKHLNVETDIYGFTHLSYKQQFAGLEVLGGVIKVHFDRDGQLYAVNGVFVPAVVVDAQPAVAQAQAERTARYAVASGKYDSPRMDAAVLSVEHTGLYVYRDGLVQGVPGENYLAWEVEVRGPNIRTFVYVDAHSGAVLNVINTIENSIHRQLYEPSIDPADLQWEEGDAYPTGDSDWDNILDGTKEAYNLFASMTNGAYLSFDGSDAIMKSVANDPQINCPNANWNGTSTNYCDDVTGDDTVAHEWTHAYTEYNHGLIYQWQPGALNESYSDIYGEVVDLINGRGKDTPGGLRSSDGSQCSKYQGFPKGTDDSYRWLSGEDDPAFFQPIRDMWRPECKGDPGKVSSSDYACSTDDSGGVHTNSGVPNHAFAMIADGGSYNGQSFTGLGLTKAAHIYWRAMHVYQTPTTDFADHADALEQSCADLVGQSLFDITTADPPWPGVGSEVISSNDCDQVTKVLLATEMRNEPTQCNFQPMLDKNTPALCTNANEGAAFYFKDDFESADKGWTIGRRDVLDPNTFDDRDWALNSSLPDGRSGSAYFGPDPVVGNCSDDLEAGVLYLESPAITVDASATDILMTFEHYVATEFEWDGGNVKISVNGGAWQIVPGAAFSFNSYPASLDGSSDNNNPLAGEESFTGTDGGEVTGSWGESQLSLNSLANPGDSIKLRFEIGADGCNGLDGWYVDEVELYQCQTCSTPVEPAPDTAKAGDDVQLSWADAAANNAYTVYKSATPYFSPGDAGVTEETLWPPFAATITFTEAGAATDAATNHYYLVRASNPCDAETADTDQQGAFTFDLTPGTN